MKRFVSYLPAEGAPQRGGVLGKLNPLRYDPNKAILAQINAATSACENNERGSPPRLAIQSASATPKVLSYIKAT